MPHQRDSFLKTIYGTPVCNKPMVKDNQIPENNSNETREIRGHRHDEGLTPPLLSHSQLYNGIKVYSIVFVLCVLISIIKYMSDWDPLDRALFYTPECMRKLTGNNAPCSWWPLSHFVMYTILGILSPKYWLLWTVLGILYECFECVLGRLLNGPYNSENMIANRKTQYGCRWMDGSSRDIIFNSLGLAVGYAVRVLANRLAPTNGLESWPVDRC